MKFALVNGGKVEASKGAKGQCPSCGSELIAKCGELKVNHWAHKGNRNCDPWWENETEWHRSWKNNFPIEWQEVVHFDESGEKHIADVKTPNGWTLEFQHSFLNPEERHSRNIFYQKLVWVVDGTRRKTDKKQFQSMLDDSIREPTNVPILRALFPDKGRLIREWHNNNALVFFDFEEGEYTDQSMLWFLFPKMPSSGVYLSPFSRKNFIELQVNNEFDELLNNMIHPINKVLDEKRKTELFNQKRKPYVDLFHFTNLRRKRKPL